MDHDENFDNRRWPPGRVFIACLAVATIFLCVYALYLCVDLLILFFMGILLSTALKRPTEWLVHLRVSRGAAVLTNHGILLFIAAGFLVFLVPLADQQSEKFLAESRTRYAESREKLVHSRRDFIRIFAANLPEDPQTLLRRSGEKTTAENLADVWSVLEGIFEKVFSLFAVFMLSIYWSLEGKRHVKSMLLAVPNSRRDAVGNFVDRVQDTLGAFLRGQAILCLAVGAMAFAVYGLIGLPNSLLLGFIAAVFELVPFLGTTLAAIPPILLAASLGVWQTIFTIAGWIVIVSVEAYVLAPRIMEKSVGVHPVLTLLAISALFKLWGLLGGVLAIPIAAIVQLTFRKFVLPQDPVRETAAGPLRDKRAALALKVKQLLADVQGVIAGQKCPPPETEMLEMLEREMEDAIAELTASESEY